ncbi:MAG: hypothetical protein V1904_08870 [Bacteroidota bacterium]
MVCINNIFHAVSKKIPVPVLVFSVLYLLIIIASRNIPMFWDMSYMSQISNMIYDSNFSVFYSDALDNGSSPLYSTYIALLWAVAGRSLFITHLAILPFVIGIVYQFHLLLNRFLEKKYARLAFLLLLIEPTLITQTIIAGYDLILCFLFLLALNGIFKNKRGLILLSVIFIPLINIRGASIVLSVFIIDLIFNTGNFRSVRMFIKSSFPYAASLVLLLLWMLYHYHHTGWLFLSHRRACCHHYTGMEGMTRNLIYALLKLFDFGRVFIFVLIITLSVKIRFKDNPLLKVLVFSMIPYLLFFLPFAYPASHRHFIHLYPVMIILFIYVISLYKQKSFRITVSVFAIISLIAGNLWIYPERYGNGWDSSLKSIPYFKLKKQLDNYVTDTRIDPADVGSRWPMNFDDYDTKLDNTHFSFADIDILPLAKHGYIAQSNISNNFTVAEIEELNKSWILEKEFSSWPVYIKLFRNPLNK